MKTLQFLLCIALVTVAACHKAPDYLTAQDNKEVENPIPIESPLVIRAGTSFGMCLGYCVTELSVYESNVTFTETSHRDPAQYPERKNQGTLSSAEWNCLLASIDWAAFQKLDSVIGCPDCADGGAEWIELVNNGVKHRVTFEYGASIPEIQPLLDRIRALRSTFKHDSYIYQTWEWAESSGGLAGVTVTPASAGYTQRQIFRNDGTVTFFRDGAEVNSTTFTITHEKTDFSSSEEDVIHYGDPSIQPQIMKVAGDTLYLTDLCYDCFGHKYVRASTICE